MKELITDTGKVVLSFLTNRIIWLMIATVLLFTVLVGQLFYLQIVISDTFQFSTPPTDTVQQTIPAPRGNIYDRFGRPLTANITAHVVTMDPTLPISNEALLELTMLFERNGENFENNFPMTTEWPYEFTLGGSTPEIQQARIYRWNDDQGIPNPRETTASEAFLHLREWFGVDPEMSNEDARKILNFRTMLFARRTNPQLFEIATDVSHATVVAIEEQNTFFSGVRIGIRTLREYPQGVYFTHMLGYTGRVTADDLLIFPDEGYTDYDMIGKTGLELSRERYLRGVQGTQIVEINPNTGRQVGTSPMITSPVPGHDIFLTLDMDRQRSTFYILKNYLTEMAIGRIQSNAVADRDVGHQQIFANLIRAGWIPTRAIMESDENLPNVYAIRTYVLERFPEATPLREDRTRIVDILVDGVQAGRITPAMLFTAMVDLEVLSDYDNFTERVLAGRQTPNNFIIEKLRMGELTPQMVNVDPATGSIMVVDVRTGAVLAAVSYPSFDNNMLANWIDPEYYARINGDDPTTPLVNRPFQEARPPGSTFKMATAAAGLERGVITPTNTIISRGVFTRAGNPPAHNWARGGLGTLNVSQAIGISCNYFFYETSFRLGNDRNQRIEVLNKYMEFFGLNQRSGVEIGEFADRFDRERTPNIMASPSFKHFQHISRNEFAPRSQWDWFDGDTIRTAIGQSYNNYTAAQMVRFIAQIANNGKRLPLRLIDSITNYQGEVVYQLNPTPDDTGMVLSDSTWEAIQQGMIIATEGRGTATGLFSNFPIRVAGKTGTAQQVDGRLAHSSFGAFAPFEDPEIAIYVVIPFGTTTIPGLTQSATRIARSVIYDFLVPEVYIERPTQINAIMG